MRFKGEFPLRPLESSGRLLFNSGPRGQHSTWTWLAPVICHLCRGYKVKQVIVVHAFKIIILVGTRNNKERCREGATAHPRRATLHGDSPTKHTGGEASAEFT